MRLFAISDLHLQADDASIMEAQHPVWDKHPDRLFDTWRAMICDEDVVFPPGDISGGNDTAAVHADYATLDRLPGQKILSPGNHDRIGWSSAEEIESLCAPFASITPLSNQALRLGPPQRGLVVCGTRGHIQPGDNHPQYRFGFRGSDQDWHQRALEDVPTTLAQAQRLRTPGDELLVMMHYPPFLCFSRRSVFTDMIEAASASLCIFGHLHEPEQWETVSQGLVRSCSYQLVSADALDMTPRELGTLDKTGVGWKGYNQP